MTWTSFHKRGESLREVIDTADRRRDGRLPIDVEGVAETFGDELSLLGALQLRWHTRLAGRIERELVAEPLDLPAAVVRAWHATADEDPGVRAVLDRCAQEPSSDAMASMMAISTDKLRAVLAISAGLSSLPATAATLRAGAELEQRARETHVPRVAEPVAPVSLLGRLRAALAA